MERLGGDFRALPNPEGRRGPQDRRQRGACSPPLQQARPLHTQWAVHRERPYESQKSSRGGRRELIPCEPADFHIKPLGASEGVRAANEVLADLKKR